jgi:hypothetical protein
MKNNIYILLVTLLTLTSCNEDITTSWLKIDTINLTTNVTTEGENSDNITDAWVFMDNQPLGVWELPCEIPILADGKHSFSINAGIKSNGINSSRVKYPFYKATDFDLTLIEGETVSYTPSVSYKSNVNITGREDFEDTGIILNPNIDLDTSKINIISKTNYPDIVKYGNNCGRMTLSLDDTITQVSTNINLDLEYGQAYMELDYYNSNSFAIGLNSVSASAGNSNNNPFILIPAQDESTIGWKKIYLDLSSYISSVEQAVSFDFYIVAAIDTDKTNSVVYLDNIKIVQYE